MIFHFYYICICESFLCFSIQRRYSEATRIFLPFCVRPLADYLPPFIFLKIHVTLASFCWTMCENLWHIVNSFCTPFAGSRKQFFPLETIVEKGDERKNLSSVSISHKFHKHNMLFMSHYFQTVVERVPSSLLARPVGVRLRVGFSEDFRHFVGRENNNF